MLLLARSSLEPILTSGWRRMALAVWPRPDKAAAPFLFYLSVIAHLHSSVHPSTHLTHRLPKTNTCSHLLLFTPSAADGLCFPPSPLASAPSTRHCWTLGTVLPWCLCLLKLKCFGNDFFKWLRTKPSATWALGWHVVLLVKFHISHSLAKMSSSQRVLS